MNEQNSQLNSERAREKFNHEEDDDEEEEEDEDQMSDYVDENFEMDETDEYWGLNKNPCHEQKSIYNDIKKVDKRNVHLKDNISIKINAGYEYVSS